MTNNEQKNTIKKAFNAIILEPNEKGEHKPAMLEYVATNEAEIIASIRAIIPNAYILDIYETGAKSSKKTSKSNGLLPFLNVATRCGGCCKPPKRQSKNKNTKRKGKRKK